ncbi:hypothetical protein J437_LFUL015957 [Ladona fulva]|uniref:Invertebrate defensins family profile domain-containing protein n=1 Tax=Ladona fulva TaxID=123851 RepID=A0A8K0KK09_LADFU|nr:hypothetical protein J437_LFUL015957 [Ladona fulva]
MRSIPSEADSETRIASLMKIKGGFIGVPYMGYGCPYDESSCSSHCGSINRGGGYCGFYANRYCLCNPVNIVPV